MFGLMHEQQEDGGNGSQGWRGWEGGEMDEGESVSPWQPITSDPTPTKKGWRDERMDGDDDGCGGVKKTTKK